MISIRLSDEQLIIPILDKEEERRSLPTSNEIRTKIKKFKDSEFVKSSNKMQYQTNFKKRMIQLINSRNEMI